MSEIKYNKKRLKKVESILISQPEPSNDASPFYKLVNNYNLKVDFRQFEKLDPVKMLKHFCKTCDSEFDGPTKIQIEEKPNEPVANGLILIERGQYTCHKCNTIIGEYRVFSQSS